MRKENIFKTLGDLKHTTLAAQFTLGYRLHGVSDTYLGGFTTPGPPARPPPATTGS